MRSGQNQRDLYLATRDLFIRHDRLAIDQVERLKKRIEANSVKLDGTRAAQKDNWQEEVDRLAALIEKDQATIAAQLNRRVFIRAWCVVQFPFYHELKDLSVCGMNYVSYYTTGKTHCCRKQFRILLVKNTNTRRMLRITGNLWWMQLKPCPMSKHRESGLV